MKLQPLAGVYAAAITPLKPDYSPNLDSIPPFLEFLACRGCHGVLLLGTTGEGPSFAYEERLKIFRAALAIRQIHPEFRLLAGTGTPSLEETINLTKAAFDLGLDGVVVLPPYYYRKVPEDGLFTWFSQVISRSVPSKGALFGYHIPGVSGIPLSLELVARLKDAFPDSFVGLKDSSGDHKHAQALGARFGNELLILTGNDRLFTLALIAGASGCITAPANLVSPALRRIWEANRRGESDRDSQLKVDQVRTAMDCYPPTPALIKSLLTRFYNFPRWTVRPPLLPLSSEVEAEAAQAIDLS